MKFKVKPEKSNLLLMSTLLLLCLTTCFMWLVIREYICFGIYFALTLIIAHMYYFTSYILKEDILIIKLGFIKIKINYNKISNIEVIKDRVKLNFKKLNINIYPNNKEIFVAKINSKLNSKEGK